MTNTPSSSTSDPSLREPGTWARSEIRTAAAHVFERPVQIDERAYQALEVVTKQGAAPRVAHVWKALAEVTPAIMSLYEALGSQFSPGMSFPDKLRRLSDGVIPAGSIDWVRVLRRIFCIEFTGPSEFTLVDAGRMVARTGHMGVSDVAHSMLLSGKHSRRWERARRTNLVMRHMARQVGVQNAMWWSHDIDALSHRARAALYSLLAVDPSFGSQQFVLYHDGGHFRLVPFGVTGAYQLAESPLPDGSLWVARGNVIQPASRFSDLALGELEGLINSDAGEVEFQRFFEQHPEFLAVLGGYTRVHPQVVLHEDDGGRLIPDFFLEKINSDFCDICDLKRATADLVRAQRHRSRFRDAVMEGVAQLSVYRDWFEDRQNRSEFRRRYGLNAYRPRVVLIIGRQRSYYDDIERIRLEGNLPGWVTLKTYDDVAATARQWRVFAG